MGRSRCRGGATTGLILAALLAFPARCQDLPNVVKDRDTMEDLEFLDEQIHKDYVTIYSVIVSSGGTNTISGPAGGDLTGSYPNPTLAPNGAKATIYGDYPWMPQFTTDLKGRIVSASTIAVQGLNPANATNGSPTGILIPLYDYPSNIFTNPDYNAIIDMKKRYHTVPLYVILNPGNGPGTVTDNNYTEASLRLEGAGAITLGYVHASYAGRALADVEADIQGWKNLYPAVNGIFVDEMSNDYNMAHITYFVNLSSFSHSLGFYPVVGNPGSTGDNVYFSSHTADIICIYESGAYPSTTTLAGNYFGGYADLTYIPRAVLSYNVAMDTGVWTRTREYAGLMYFTDVNGWSSPSTYLEKEFQFLSNETTTFYQNMTFASSTSLAGYTVASVTFTATAPIIGLSSIQASGFFGDGSSITNLLGTNIQAGTVQTQQLASDAVTSAKLINASVSTGKIANDSVTTVALLNQAVSAVKMVNSGVFTGDATTTFPTLTIGNGAITNPKLASSAVQTGDIASDAVNSSAVLNASVQTSKLASDAVSAVAILNGSVQTSKMATDSVIASAIKNYQIQTAKLAVDAITSTSILNATIGSAKLASVNAVNGPVVLNASGYIPASLVNTATLATDAVTGAAILNQTIGSAKLANVNAANGPVVLDNLGRYPGLNGSLITSVTAVSVEAGGVNTAALATDAVTATAILNQTITGAKLANQAVTAAQIANNTVNTNQLAADAVTSSILLNGAVQTGKLATDAVTAASIRNASVQTSALAADSVISAAIINASVTTSKIAVDAVDTASILNGSVGTTKLDSSTCSANDAFIWTGSVWTCEAAVVQSGTVNTASIQSDAVTSVKIINFAVQTNKLATDAVSSSSILNGAVTTSKLAVDAVTASAVMSSEATLSKASGGDISASGGVVSATKAPFIVKEGSNQFNPALAFAADNTSGLGFTSNLGHPFMTMLIGGNNAGSVYGAADNYAVSFFGPLSATKYNTGTIGGNQGYLSYATTGSDTNLTVDPYSGSLAQNVEIARFTPLGLGVNITVPESTLDVNGTTNLRNGLTVSAGSSATLTIPLLANATVQVSAPIIFGVTGGSGFSEKFTNSIGVTGYMAKSIDGAIESSGCLVALAMDSADGNETGTSNVDPGYFTFTSTTTAALTAPLGVLLQSCGISGLCFVGVRGPMRVQRVTTTPYLANAGYGAQTSTTRCKATEGQAGGTAIPYLNANDGSGWAWVLGDGD